MPDKFTERDLEPFLDNLKPEVLNDETVAYHQARMRNYGNTILAEIGAGGSFNMLNPYTTQYMNRYAGKKIKGINNTTRNMIESTLTEGIKAGEGIPELSRRITSEFNIIGSRRAQTIARTEVVGASNAATYSAHKQSGIVKKRQWVATADNRTRDLHSALNMKIVKINERFRIGGYSTLAPGNFNKPEMDINCRCTTIAVIDKPLGLKYLKYHWKNFIRDIDPWECELKARFRIAFKKQKNTLLAELAKFQ